MKTALLLTTAAGVALAAGCSSANDGSSLSEATTQASPSSYAYAFDPSGLLAKVTSNGASYGIARTGDTMQAGTDTYRFDALGRVVAIDATVLAYGPDGQVDHVTAGGKTTSYVYDEDGKRIAKSAGGAVFAAYLDEGYLTATELDEPLRVEQHVVGVVKNGVFELLGSDHRGTVEGDANGAARTASPFGARATHPDFAATVDYAASPYDADLAAVRMGVRDYDARIGRFLQPDPLFLLSPDRCVTSPSECNLYGYARGNPVDYTDPSGNEAEGGDKPAATPPNVKAGETLDSVLGPSEGPMTKAEMNHLLSLGPTSAAGNTPISAGTGFTSYQPTSRQWAKPEAVEALRNIGDAWSAAHPGEPRIQVGDVGKPEGGPFPPHKSHQNGVDLDVRPMRSDGREGPTQWNNAQTYSRDLTRDLVRTIVGNGSLPVRMIFFNDPQLQREFPGVVLPQHGHDDHLHIRFQTP